MIRRSILLVTAALMLVVGCAQPTPRAEGPITVRGYLPRSPVSLSMIGKASDLYSEVLASQVTDSLVQYDDRLVLQPRLAESWEFSENGRVVTFKLRRGVTWHDGEPLTAEDVMYTVRMVREPALENRSFGPAFAADKVEVSAPDEYTIVASYDLATADVLDAWRLPIVPEHIGSKDAAPGDGHPERFLDGELSRHPIGCGPFRFVRHVVDTELVLEANDDYWDGRPAIDRLLIKIIPDQRTAMMALLAGDLDIMNLSSVLWNEALESPEGERLDGFVYHRLNIWHLQWNQDGSNPFFTDPRVRRAMTLALDREKFSETMQNGLARPGITALHPESVWADPELEPWPYDVEEARRLLDEAGWVDTDGDGVRERDGVRFSFTHMIPASSQSIVDDMAAWEAQSWAEIGIESSIERLEFKQFQERRNRFDFQAASFSISFSPDPNSLWDLLHSTARDEGWNFAGFHDPEVDRLLEAGRQTFAPEERRRIYLDLQRRVHELEPVTCLFHFPIPVLHDKRLKGVTPSPIDYWRTTRGPRLWRWEASAG